MYIFIQIIILNKMYKKPMLKEGSLKDQVIVVTGGGSQLQHLKQLVEYITGMDTRIGYPNEHLAGDSDSDTTSPMYATAVGLVLNSLQNKERAVQLKYVHEGESENDMSGENIDAPPENELDSTPKDRKRFFDKWAEKFKEFLDNAE